MKLATLAAVRRSWDSDAGTYLKAVEAADQQQLEPYVAQLINQFVLGCKADGIWSAIQASCILMGARTLSGALVPLVGSAPTNNNFVSGDYDRKTGLVGDGSTKYLNTNRAGNADAQNDCHAAVYVSSYVSTQSNYRAFIGSGDQQSGASNLFWLATTQSGTRSRNGTPDLGNITGTLSAGLYGMSRSASANYSLRANGSTVTITRTSNAAESFNWWVFTTNNNGAAINPTSSRLAWYSVGSAVTLSTLGTRLTTLYNAIRAAIP